MDGRDRVPIILMAQAKAQSAPPIAQAPIPIRVISRSEFRAFAFASFQNFSIVEQLEANLN